MRNDIWKKETLNVIIVLYRRMKSCGKKQENKVVYFINKHNRKLVLYSKVTHKLPYRLYQQFRLKALSDSSYTGIMGLQNRTVIRELK